MLCVVLSKIYYNIRIFHVYGQLNFIILVSCGRCILIISDFFVKPLKRPNFLYISFLIAQVHMILMLWNPAFHLFYYRSFLLSKLYILCVCIDGQKKFKLPTLLPVSGENTNSTVGNFRPDSTSMKATCLLIAIH